MKPLTPIPWTTRYGKRWPVHRWNPSVRLGKLEPSRRRRSPLGTLRIGEPGAKSGTPLVPVELVASSLLVILHYLLKNNIEFMRCNVQVQLSPRFLSPNLRLRGGN